MLIEDNVTSSLPLRIREPLLLLLDEWGARRIWVVRMLTWANYHVSAPDRAIEAARWFVQHLVTSQVFLLREPHRNEQEITQILKGAIVLKVTATPDRLDGKPISQKPPLHSSTSWK